MTITEEITIPSDSELTVQEITISSPVLRATANYMGQYCDEKCKVRLRDDFVERLFECTNLCSFVVVCLQNRSLCFARKRSAILEVASVRESW